MRNKNVVAFGGLAVVIALIAVSLAYAGFTQTLNINGSAGIKAAKWDVHFANLVESTSGSTVVGVPATIKSGNTSIGNYSVTFFNPGDSLTYTFDVVNSGNFSAQLTGVNIGVPSCKLTVTGQTNTNAINVCNNISYELFDATTGVKITAPDNGVVVANGGTRHLRLVLTYNNTTNETYIANNDIEITGLAVTLTYSQYGSYVAP
jgi:hypothetical protein